MFCWWLRVKATTAGQRLPAMPCHSCWVSWIVPLCLHFGALATMRRNGTECSCLFSPVAHSPVARILSAHGDRTSNVPHDRYIAQARVATPHPFN